MGCVCMHWGIPAIEGCGNPNHVWDNVEKIGEDNEKAKKTNWAKVKRTP
jgi:hypothetical protein